MVVACKSLAHVHQEGPNRPGMHQTIASDQMGKQEGKTSRFEQPVPLFNKIISNSKKNTSFLLKKEKETIIKKTHIK